MEKVTVEWANEAHTIVLITYHTNDWQWPDLYAAFAQQHTLLNQTEAPIVHTIVDVTQSQLMPKGGAMSTLSRKLGDMHPKQGTTVIVGAKGIVAKMLEIATIFLGAKRSSVQTAPSMEAAHKMLAQKLAEANQRET